MKNSVLSLKFFLAIGLIAIFSSAYSCDCELPDLYGAWHSERWGKLDYPNVVHVKFTKVDRDRAYFRVIDVYRGVEKSINFVKRDDRTSCRKPFPKDLAGKQMILFDTDGPYPFLYRLCSPNFEANKDNLRKVEHLNKQ